MFIDTVKTIKNKLKHIDYPLLLAILLLACFGMMMIFSSSNTLSYLSYDTTSHFFVRQLQWFLFGIVLMVIAMLVPHQLYNKLSPVLVLLSLLLLFVVLLPGIGVERNYSQRWIAIGPLLFQPSEAVKLFMIVYFASFYSKKQHDLNQFKKGVLPPLIILGAVFLLTLQQPDLGSAALTLFACGTIVICSGVKRRHLTMLTTVGVLGVSYFAYSSPYRLERLTSYMSPFQDPLGDGYQLINSYVAIAEGGVVGNGLGSSVQKLGFLPEAHTDFIMAVIVEELGVIGLLFVIGVYVFIMLKGIQIAKKSSNGFSRLLAIGITFQMIIQVIFNLGGASGLFPITGIPLPLISYGGSSLIITMFSLGVLLQISAQNNLRIQKKG